VEPDRNRLGFEVQNVFIGKKSDSIPPGFVEVPKGNDRFYLITLRSRGRTITGTATLWRWFYLMQAIKQRYPRAHISTKPIVIRARKFGPVVVLCEILPGKGKTN